MARGARGGGRVDAAMVVLAVALSMVALALPASLAEHAASTLRRTVLAPLVALQQRAERARRAIAQYDSITRMTDSVLMRAVDADRLAAENTHLRKLLQLGARLPWDYVAADALHGPPLGEEHTIVLSAGTAAGIQPFSAVVTPDGIVGYVRSVGATTSVAIVWPHPDFRVSAVTVDGRAFGIVAAFTGSDRGHFLLELRGVPFRSPLDTGTLVVSSGFGGTFPRGIPIGTILAELPGAEGWERSYLIEPAVRAADVGTVLVLTGLRARGGGRGDAWPGRDSTEEHR